MPWGVSSTVLVERGLEGETLVAFTSDHGEEFLEHGLIGHSKQLFRESMAVPLILAGPGIPGGQRIESVVENRHLAATLLHLVGLEHPDFTQLLPLEPDPESISAQPLFHTTLRGRWPLTDGSGVLDVGALHGIRTPETLLVWAPTGGGGQEELVAAYDLPSEQPRQLEESERQALLRALADWLEAGARGRPRVLGGGEGTLDLLRALGYVDEDR